jgi:hypothetical protein
VPPGEPLSTTTMEEFAGKERLLFVLSGKLN